MNLKKIKKPKITLICCTIYPNVVVNFINSLVLNNFYNFELIVGNSSIYKIDLNLINPNVLDKIKIFEIPNFSLSAARNYLLNCNDIGDIICFPDDDCIYPPYILDAIVANYNSNHDDNMIGVCFSFPGSLFCKNLLVTKMNMFGRLISFNFFIFKDRIQPNVSIQFDEKFGIGARYDWGEEAELLGRLLGNYNYFKQIHDFVIFHPLKDTLSYERNFRRGRGVGAFVYLTSKYINWSFSQKLRLLFGTQLRVLFFLLTFRFRKASYYFVNAMGKLVGYVECIFKF